MIMRLMKWLLTDSHSLSFFWALSKSKFTFRLHKLSNWIFVGVGLLEKYNRLLYTKLFKHASSYFLNTFKNFLSNENRTDLNMAKYKMRI